MSLVMRPPEPPSDRSKAKMKYKARRHERHPFVSNRPSSFSPFSESEVVVFVPTAKVGYLIGYAGRTVSGFERRSGAKIDVLRPNSREEETPVALSGSRDAVSRVVR